MAPPTHYQQRPHRSDLERSHGSQLGQLPDSELAVWSSPEHELLVASDRVWRWLGWLVPQDGQLVRLLTETRVSPPLLNPPAQHRSDLLRTRPRPE